MLSVISIVGAIIGLIVFLNLISSGQKSRSTDLGSSPPPNRSNRKAVVAAAQGAGARICPVCASPLTMNEYLIAAIGPDPGHGGRRQAQIFGCPHCFASDGIAENRPKSLSEVTL